MYPVTHSTTRYQTFAIGASNIRGGNFEHSERDKGWLAASTRASIDRS